jgi:DegV family protein with EDD domain
MTIGIVTDSTCDLPTDVAAALGVEVVPLYINFGSQSYLDGVDLSREAFYARLPDADPPPTTAMPGPQFFLAAYERLAEQGVTEIISIHVSRTLSAVHDTARLAANEARIPVTLFDSGSLSLGLGFLVWAAAEAAADTGTLDDVLAILEDQRKRTHVFAALDTLEFLRRSGRMNRVMATLGSWLQMKPLLKMHDGVSDAEKIRTTDAAMQRLTALLEATLPVERVAMVHTHSLVEAEELRRLSRHLLPDGDILSVDVTPVLGTHLGPGAVGFVCVRESGVKR